MEIEAECMMDMITQQIIPALQRAAGEQSMILVFHGVCAHFSHQQSPGATKGSDAFGGIIADLEGGISFMKDSMAAMHAEGDLVMLTSVSTEMHQNNSLFSATD